MIIDRRDMRDRIGSVLNMLMKLPMYLLRMKAATRTLAEWLALQEQVHASAIDLGLGRVGTVARPAGRGPAPLTGSSPSAATNGKGSTVATIEALLLALQLRVGTLTSPHLLRYNERIHVDGREATDAELIGVFDRIEAARGATHAHFLRVQHAGRAAVVCRPASGRGGAGGGIGRAAGCRQPGGCRCRGGVFGRVRPSRLAGGHPGGHRRGKSRNIPRASPRGARHDADAGQCLRRHRAAGCGSGDRASAFQLGNRCQR